MNKKELERLVKVEQTTINIKDTFDDFMNNHFATLVKKVDCITKKMGSPRLPIWATFLITFFCSLCVGLVVAMVK